MRDSTITAIETIVLVLHRYGDMDCDAMPDDATEDHDTELALAGQIINDLRVAGLIIAKRRSDAGRSRPRYLRLPR